MTYILHLVVMLSIYGMLALSANMLVGFSGMLSLLSAAFFGLGAYLFAILSVTAGWPFGVAFFSAVAGGAVVGWLVSLLLLRFRGETFSVATMAVQMIMFGVFYNWTDITGGPYGFPDIPRPSAFGCTAESPIAFALLTLSTGGAVCVLLHAFSRSRFALFLRALRDDEAAAASLGLAPNRHFAAAFVFSAVIASIPGALFASYVAYVDPTSFGIGESVLVLAMLVVGGCGNLRGPLSGMLFLVLLPEVLRFLGLPAEVAAPAREMIYGLLLIVFMYVRPKGFAGDYAV